MESVDVVELYLVRHGLTAWNRDKRYQGHRDIPILPEATEDIRRVARALPASPFDAIHSSDLIRCLQTLACLLEGRTLEPAPQIDARLREMNFGDYEGKRYEDLRTSPHYRAWLDTTGEQVPPNGESAAVFHQRIDDWLSELLESSRHQPIRQVLVVTHGGVVRSLRQRHEGVEFWEGGLGHGEGWRLGFVFEAQDSVEDGAKSQRSKGTWRCKYSSAVPTPVSAPQ